MKKRLKLVLTVLFFVNAASAWEISFVGQGYNPEPNEEITLQIQTDVPLFTMAAGIYIVGDANIAGAMCEADCNQYGWDNGWGSDPYIDDANGWVYIQGISWSGADPNGIVGYIKFRYNGGQVGVCMDQENSSAFGWDGNSYSDVPFTTDVLFFGEPDPNDPNFLNPNDPNDPNIPNDPNDPNAPLAGDVNIINFEDFAVFANNWQQCDTGLECDFDESGCVDFNDLKIFCDYWLESTICEVCKFGFGTGTQNDPYRIRTFDDLCLMMTTGSSSYWELCNDIDASASSSLDGGAGWTPFDFSGHLDGYGYKISNLYINRPSLNYTGFIRTNTGSVSNLGLLSVSITGDTAYVGGFCGYNMGTITSCYFTGTVSGTGSVGSFCGLNWGTITSCYSTGTVSGTAYVGGFCGYNMDTITSCYSTGTVSGISHYVGGFCGWNGYYATITNCYSTGSVSGTISVGSFCGYNRDTLTNCYSTGTVSGDDRVGGFCGWNSDSGNITDCYSTGSVNGNDEVGGFCGLNGDTLTNCYSTGTVSGDGDYVGGFCGDNSSTISSCYFLITAGPDNGFGTPKTAGQLAEGITYIDWDFNYIWIMCIPAEPGEECVPITPLLRTFYGL